VNPVRLNPAVVTSDVGEFQRALEHGDLWTERAHPRLIHYHQLEKGAHFAAWERPKLLVDEMRLGLKSLR
jgi:hypothetical protein